MLIFGLYNVTAIHCVIFIKDYDYDLTYGFFGVIEKNRLFFMGLPKKLKLELFYVYLLKVYGLVQLIFIFNF